MRRVPPRTSYISKKRRRIQLERLESRLAMDAELAELLPRFGTLDNLADYLMKDALAQYDPLFGQQAGARCFDYCAIPVALTLDLESMTSDRQTIEWHSAAADEISSSVSSTNVQVQGVDEADIVEADDGHLYVLGANELSILGVDEQGQSEILSRVTLPGRGLAEFLRGDRLTVISTESFWGNPIPLLSLAAADVFRPIQYVDSRPSVTVTVFDIHDRTAPRVTEQTKLDGSFVDARAIDDKVLVVVSNQDLQLPPPEQICTKDGVATVDVDPGIPAVIWFGDARTFAPWGNPTESQVCTYETREAWLTRVTAQIDEFIVERLPHFTSTGPDGQFVRAGLLHEPGDVVRPVSDHPSQLLSIVTFDVDDADAGVLGADGILAGYASEIYASRDSVVVAEPTWDDASGKTSTRLVLYRWEAESGSPRAAAVGQVPGNILNSFAIDVYHGTLRVATTTTNGWEPLGANSSNHLYVLETMGTTMDIVGQLNDFGVTERIYSVRFMGDTAVVVTFRQMDPVFTIDLSTPTKPQIVGELELPGFSSYLQMLDERHLLGIGVNIENGMFAGPQLSLFDIGDLAHPLLLDRYDLPSTGSTMATWDHHALLWDATTHTLALPMDWARSIDTESNDPWTMYETVHQLLVLNVDTASSETVQPRITLRGAVTQEKPVVRSVLMGDRLLSLSGTDMMAVDVNDPSEVLSQIELFSWEEEPPLVLDGIGNAFSATSRFWASTEDRQSRPADTPTPLDDAGLDEALQQVRQDLIARLQITAARIRLISAEPWRADDDAGTASGILGFDIVLGVGAQRYRFRGDTNSGFTLVDDAFEFATQPTESPWHNAHNPFDASGDGVVAPHDALVIVNELNRTGPRELRVPVPHHAIRPLALDVAVTYFWDSDGDHFIAPIDALRIINWLNARPSGEGEGADELTAPLASPDEAENSATAPIAVDSATSRMVPTAATATDPCVVAAKSWSIAVDAVVQQAAVADDEFWLEAI